MWLSLVLCFLASINQTSLVGAAFQAGNVLIVQLFDFQYRIARILGIALIKGHGEILLTKVTSFRQLSELRKYCLAIACCAALAALPLRLVSSNATVGLRPDGQLCKGRWKGRGSLENRKGTTQHVGHCAFLGMMIARRFEIPKSFKAGMRSFKFEIFTASQR